MARKKSHVFQKLSSNLLKIPIFIAKLRKPIIPKLISLKKSSRVMKTFKHYNYGYIQEYQFSPSSSPLIPFYQRKQLKKISNARDIYSIIFLLCPSTCFGGLRDDNTVTENYPLEFEALPAPMQVAMAIEEFSASSSEYDSVDERAERFIERFYKEMRNQRRDSFSQISSGQLEK